MVDKVRTIKVQLTLQGATAERVRLLQVVLGLNSEADTMHHLIKRGIGAEAGTVAAWNMGKQTMEAITSQFAAMGEQIRLQFDEQEPSSDG